MLRFILISSFFLASLSASAQQLVIKIKDKHSGDAIPNCTVEANNSMKSSDSKGIIIFEKMPKQHFTVKVSAVGYSTQILNQIRIEGKKTIEIEVEMEMDTKELPSVEIRGLSKNNSNPLTSIKSIELEEILRLPATFLDPARLAFSFAGVVNTNDQANNMVVRGNAPQTMQWRIEGTEIVNPNHLSNAGTTNDQATSTGGGTNILSAQMLGNMSLLTGAFGAEYGNVNGGIMDMGFRKGNQSKHQQTVQIGLIGIDLSAEGPLNSKMSYLFNYRYSFTGLLGLMGVRFGGESIKFQDFGLTIAGGNAKRGFWKLYSMAGNSSNEFIPPTDSMEWTSEKDLSNIDFYSKMGLIGIRYEKKLSKKMTLHTTINESGLQNLRSAYIENPVEIDSYKYQRKNILSGNVNVTGDVKQLFEYKVGVIGTHYFDEYNFNNKDNSFYSFDYLNMQFFAKISNYNVGKWRYNLGVNVPYYTRRRQTYVEPRASVAYYLNSKSNIALSYGLHSHQVFEPERIAVPSFPARAHHINLQYQNFLNASTSLTVEGYVQSYFMLPDYENSYISLQNGFMDENLVETYRDKKNQGLNYGIEASIKKYVSKGLYYALNTSVFRSLFYSQVDQAYHSTRFDYKMVSNLSLGKEWGRKKIKGINARIVYVGAAPDYLIDKNASFIAGRTRYNINQPLLADGSAYFRPDLRVYIKTQKRKFNTTLSLDIQNVSNTQNKSYDYFDKFKGEIITKYQLGLLPLINYRVEI